LSKQAFCRGRYGNVDHVVRIASKQQQ
jgi:hypothetical protein